MLDLNLKDILKLAEEMGIEYEVNSKTPGFFVTKDGGVSEKVELKQIVLIDDQDIVSRREIDDTISQMLKNIRPAKKRLIKVEEHLDFPPQGAEVAA